MFEETVKNVYHLLNDNSEWIDRYRQYASYLAENSSKIESLKEGFHQWAPLYLYMNIGLAKGAANSFSLRYKGQNVAAIKAENGKITLSTKVGSTNYVDTNKKYFGIDLDLEDSVEWTSEVAKEFRSQFKHCSIDKNPKVLEHAFESAFLTELEKDSAAEKLPALCGIQPVKLADICRFQMCTPLKASSGSVEHTGASGGGIDILARVGLGSGSQLCVMELKQAPDKDAMKQAVAYAAFLMKLLTDEECGQTWHNIFGYKRPFGKKIKVCTVMPENLKRTGSPIFSGETLETPDGILELHQIYVNQDWQKGLKIESSSLLAN